MKSIQPSSAHSRASGNPGAACSESSVSPPGSLLSRGRADTKHRVHRIEIRARSLAAAALQVVLLAGAITFSTVPARSAETVKIDSFSFVPQRLTVKAGTTVTWDNKDDIPHNIASTTKLFRSKVLDTDDHFSFTFTTPGTYEYFCSLHPHMTGTIVVEAMTGGSVP
jgi:plastocyanin